MAWQNMESAPRDGSRFWGKRDDDAIAVFWHSKFEAFVSSFRRMTMAPGYTVDGESYSDHSPRVEHPTGWMPMPEDPPRPKTAQQGEE